MAAVVCKAASEAMEVAQTSKQAVSLAARSRSVPAHSAETELTALLLGEVAALPPYRAAALVRQFLAVRQPAALSL